MSKWVALWATGALSSWAFEKLGQMCHCLVPLWDKKMGTCPAVLCLLVEGSAELVLMSSTVSWPSLYLCQKMLETGKAEGLQRQCLQVASG